MGDYLRIARAYLHAAPAAVWCFMFLGLLMVSAGVGELARNQGAIHGGVLSRKSYMAMFVYFNACLLGVLLRDNMAHPWASVLPRYRQKHLLITTLIALFFLGIPMFSMEFVGTSNTAPTSVVVIFLTCLAAGLWTLHHPVLTVLVFPFLVFVYAHSSSSPELAAFLAGTNPGTSAALVFMSLMALWALAWRLLVLNGEMIEYAVARVWGDLLRGRGFRGHAKTVADYPAALPDDQRATLQNVSPHKSLFSTLKQADNLSGYSERSLWQRLQLWRLGTAPTRTSVSVGWLIVITLIVIPLMVLIQRWSGLPASNAVVIMSVQVMTNPVSILLFWFMRLQRLGYESLRPRTRQEFVRELGLALLWDLIQCWLGGVMCMGIAAAIWAPELLQFKNLLLFILCTGVGQLCAYAMYAMMGISLLKQGTVQIVSCAFCPFVAMASWMLFIVPSIGVVANIVIASVLAAASVATIALAYRRWCRADLG